MGETNLTSKPYAINTALDVFKARKDKYSNLYVSADAIKAKQVIDYLGDCIFGDLDGDTSGWLFFFDPTPFANWDHPCKYLLVIDSGNYEEIGYDKGLDESIQMEKIY